jgi:hypothetical protein
MSEEPALSVAIYPPAAEGFPYVAAVKLPTGEVRLKACPTHMDAVAFTEETMRRLLVRGGDDH